MLDTSPVRACPPRVEWQCCAQVHPGGCEMSAPIPVLRTLPEMRTCARTWRQAGETFGLVPTMGALHAGHLELVRQVKARCRRVVVSIFVNPTNLPRMRISTAIRATRRAIWPSLRPSVAMPCGRRIATSCIRKLLRRGSCPPGSGRSGDRVPSAFLRRRGHGVLQALHAGGA